MRASLRAAAALLAGLAGLGGAGPVGCGAPVPRRSILLVIADSLRADHLGAYGYARATSPALDALAAEGVLFERAYSQSSWTSPSVASLFTSLYPSVHRLGHEDTGYGYTWRLPEATPTLAAVLRDHGFRTHAILNNPSISRRRGFARGFDAYENAERTTHDRPVQPSDARVIERLEHLRADDFLLVWHILDPHWPYYPPAEYRMFVDPAYRGRFERGFTREFVKPLVAGKLALSDREREQVVGLYDGEIRFVDDQVRRVLEAVDALGLRSRLSVVFTSDHGEALLERGHFGHVLPMYEENLQVPLLVRDDRLSARRVPQVVEMIDVMPTLLELAGVPVPGGLQGRSLMPLLRGREREWREEPAYSEAPQFVERKTVRDARFRLIWGVAGEVLNDAFQPAVPGFPQFVRRFDHKLYDHGEGGVARPLEGEYAEAARALAHSARETMERNEGAQISERSEFRSFYFAEDWRRRAAFWGGRVGYGEGALHLGEDADAFVSWQLDFPRPVHGLDVRVLAGCDRPVRFFTVSPDGQQSASAAWRRSAGPRFRNARIRADDLSGTRVLYFQFHQAKPANCSLKGFTVHALFETEEGLDAESRENLRILGYAE